jgi:hypothetical protein
MFDGSGWPVATPTRHSEKPPRLLGEGVTLTDGWFIPEVGFRYRKHDAQSTAHPAHREGEEWAARTDILEAHALALASSVRNQS